MASPGRGVFYGGPNRPDSVVEQKQPSGLRQNKNILLLAIVVGSFGVLWPHIFCPVLFGGMPAPAPKEEGEIGQEGPNQNANPSRGFLHPETKERARAGATVPGAGGGRRAPPLPVRTINKEWMNGQGGPMPGIRSTMGRPGAQPTQPMDGGIMGVAMPLYTIVIIIVFLYTTMKIVNKNKIPEEEDDEDEEDFNNKISANITKHNADDKSKIVKQSNHDCSRASSDQPQQDKVVTSPKHPAESNSRVENIIPGENIINDVSNHDENEDKEVENAAAKEDITKDKSPSNCSSNTDDNKIKDGEPSSGKENKKSVEEETPQDVDPRDLEIKMLKDRLEQTDKALNAIVNQMRLLTNKLAQHGCIQTSDQGNNRHCCSTVHANNKENT